MANVKTFQKILDYRQVQKNDAQMAYSQSVESFEAIATKLYNLLRKKEEIERQYQTYIENVGTVTTIATHYSYLEQLNKKILQLEVTVNKARNEMDIKQLALTDAHIEVKKFEKLIEQKKQKQVQLELIEDNKVMDETSVRQFLFHKDR
ncbi:flagellar export protein FliJ [Aquibacillus kalidii]|uniref:flagellar export protein FliJ n=1 Tax=Aquibacillus kalidii TaxID=2762597 RepID=UPI00164455EE|nr:flagellar export protein FliJ [Aquibacillus kalidii]